jgi:hypothetical protein
MGHSGKVKFRIGMKSFAIKPIENRGRSSPIKAAIVEAQPNLSHPESFSQFSCGVSKNPQAKPSKMGVSNRKVKGKDLVIEGL